MNRAKFYINFTDQQLDALQKEIYQKCKCNKRYATPSSQEHEFVSFFWSENNLGLRVKIENYVYQVLLSYVS